MRLRDRICVSISSAALLIAVLAVGGALRWTQAVVAGLVALALATQVFARRRLDRTSPLVAFLGLAVALTAIQLIPLPAGVLQALDGPGAQIRAEGATLSATQPWQCISLDPAETVRALAFFVTLLGVALLAVRYASSERGRFALLGGLAVVCGVTALVTGVHTLLNADLLYGVYAPHEFAHPPAVFGPLLNPNHLGGLMGLGAVLSFGLAFYGRQISQLRVLWIVVGLACTVVCAATQSRGAMLGLVVGLIVTGALTVAGRVHASRRGSGGRMRNDVPLLVVIGLGLAVVLYVSAGGVAQQLNNTSLVELNQPSSKYAAWRSSLELVREAPVLGIGRGAEETTLTRVFRGSAYFTYSHLENEYLSAIVDWGVAGAVLLAAAFLWCARTAYRRWRDGPLAAAAIGALSAIMLQSGVDFGIELLGLALPVVIIAATVELVPLRATDGPMLLLRARRVALVVALAVLAVALTQPLTTSVQEDHDTIADRVASTQDLRAIVERHPMDYVAFGELARTNFEHDTPAAVAFLNHALTLHPTHLGLHRLAARMFVAAHLYAQAAVEYSLAMSADPAPLELLTEAVKMLPSATDVTRAIPADYPNVDMILRSLHELDRDDISVSWLARVARRPQHDTQVIDLLYELTMTRKDYVTAKATAELRLETVHTTHSRLLVAKAQLLLREYDALLLSLADVAKWNGPITDRSEGWLILCDVHIARRDWNAALLCLHKLDGSGLLAATGRGGVVERLANITEERTHDSKMEQVEAMKKKYGAPSVRGMSSKDDPDADVTPNVTPATPTSAPTKPALGIPNPFGLPKTTRAPAFSNPLTK